MVASYATQTAAKSGVTLVLAGDLFSGVVEVGFDGFSYEFGSGGGGWVLLYGLVDLFCELAGDFDGYPVAVSHCVSPLIH